MSTAERVLLVATIALLLVGSCGAISFQLLRRLDHDEAEYLHAAWLMDEGKRIYRDFMEDHPPFLFQVLSALRPDTQDSDTAPHTLEWATRGRIFVAVSGTLAALAAALAVWRATRVAGAAALTLASILAGYYTWLRAIAEIRADAPTLGLFMLGLLLLIWDDKPSWRMAWLTGTGIALAVAAEIWNPKWPLDGLCLGIFFLYQLGRLIRVRKSYAVAAIVPTLVVSAIAYRFLTSATTLRDYVFFNFTLKSKNLGGLETQRWMTRVFEGHGPMYYAPPHVVGITAVLLFVVAVVLVGYGWRTAGRDRGLRCGLLLAMAVTSLAEVRFLYPWPHLWPQFFLMFAFAMSMVFGVSAGAIVEAAARIRNHRYAPAAAIGVAVLASIVSVAVLSAAIASLLPSGWPLTLLLIALISSLVPAVIVATHVQRKEHVDLRLACSLSLFAIALAVATPELASRTMYPIAHGTSASWDELETLRRRLAPGDTVWVYASRRPIESHDATYFWYSLTDLVPMTIERVAKNPELRAYLPFIQPADLPICQLARGEAPSLRFIEVSAYVDYIPGTCGCANRALSRSDVVPTSTMFVYEVLRPGEAAPPRTAPIVWDRILRSRIAGCK